MIITQNLRARVPVQRNVVNYDSWPIEWLANYIEKLQRKTIIEKSTQIRQSIRQAKVICQEKNNHILQLEGFFAASFERLSAHMKKEEQYLFPFIREMAQAKELNRSVNRAALDKMEGLIESLNDEHARERRHLKWGAELRDKYAAIANLNKPVNTLLTLLAEYEQACELHIILQYKFLFPKIIAAKYAVV